ncbi:uncharacterized protein LOC116746650 [Phocoena sinus]|uniref:uncharacterized protein LOC116746650 n=1 Tax=Phocoena sinus TaxID=42100 RepID=UPI0013C42F5B|nr:uncharacterized protein LOC116746650 [Phocoena sinus]
MGRAVGAASNFLPRGAHEPQLEGGTFQPQFLWFVSRSPSALFQEIRSLFGPLQRFYFRTRQTKSPECWSLHGFCAESQASESSRPATPGLSFSVFRFPHPCHGDKPKAREAGVPGGISALLHGPARPLWIACQVQQGTRVAPIQAFSAAHPDGLRLRRVTAVLQGTPVCPTCCGPELRGHRRSGSTGSRPLWIFFSRLTPGGSAARALLSQAQPPVPAADWTSLGHGAFDSLMKEARLWSWSETSGVSRSPGTAYSRPLLDHGSSARRLEQQGPGNLNVV